MRIARIAVTVGIGILALMPRLQASDWTAVVKQVMPSIVSVESRKGSCTGFVIDAARKYVLTANHCDAGDDTGRVWADRVLARVVSKDTHEDLLVLEVSDLDPSRPALKLAPSDPTTGEEVASFGYGYALEKALFRMAHISATNLMMPDIGGPFVSVDAGYVSGQSGGPVVNHAGEVVSIVQQASGLVGIGVSASIMRDRTGRFWQQQAPASGGAATSRIR